MNVRPEQVAQVNEIRPHPRWPASVIMNGTAVTHCHAAQPGFSSSRSVILRPGQEVEFVVAADVFRYQQPGDKVDGALFAYYVMMDYNCPASKAS